MINLCIQVTCNCVPVVQAPVLFYVTMVTTALCTGNFDTCMVANDTALAYCELSIMSGICLIHLIGSGGRRGNAKY